MTDAAHPTSSSSATRWLWLAAIVCMLAELLLFVRMTEQHHAVIYPRWNDQIQYLSESYQAYEKAEADGFLAGLKTTLTKPALQGVLHDFCALFVFKLTGGASRSAALSLNLLVFLAWQATLLAVVTRVSGSRALGWAAFGLVLCLAWPWSSEPGSAVDFRLDHASTCLMGVTATVALLTDGFRSRRWSLIFGAAVGLTLLTRFLTGAYFAPIFAASAVWILCGDRSDRWPRLRHLIYAGLVAAVIAGPAFWFNRMSIYTYYWVGHVSGAESAARLPGLGFGPSLRYVFGGLANLHLGAFFLLVAGALTSAWAALALSGRRRPDVKLDRDGLFLALAFFVLPGLVLSLHRQKSEFVLGVIAPGAVLLVVWAWMQLWRKIDFSGAPPWRRFAPLALALVALACGARYYVARQLWMPHPPGFLAHAEKVNQLADHIFHSARTAGLANPIIGVDQIVDFIDAQILRVICYERHGVWVNFVIQLPDSILTSSDESQLYRLKLCDFVLLTEKMPGDGYWPYDKQMRRLFPQLKFYCEENLRPVALIEIFDREMSLYQRREIP